MGGCAPAASGEGESLDALPRRAGCRTPADALAGGGQEVRIRRAPGQAKPAGFVRGPPSVDRLSRLLRAWSVRLARPRLPRLLPGRRSGQPPGPSERARHYPRVRLTRATEGHRTPEGANGLEDAVVHPHRQL